MPTMADKTIIINAVNTNGNGGRKLVRLSDGSLVALVKDSTRYYLYKSIDSGATWTLGYAAPAFASLQDACMVCDGTRIYVLCTRDNNCVSWYSYDYSLVLKNSNNIDGSNQTAVGNCSLTINGSELHAAWASKNAVYPDSFNIRYAKSPIVTGVPTFGTVVQITSYNTVGIQVEQPSIVCNGNGYPVILAVETGASNNGLYAFAYNGTTWATWRPSYTGYAHRSPSAIHISPAISGIATHGRIRVVWVAKDIVSNTMYSLWTCHSDNGGITWSTPVKLTTDASYNYEFPSISWSNDNFGMVYVQTTNGNGVSRIWCSTAGVWNVPEVIKASTYNANVSAIMDTSLTFQIAPFITTNTNIPRVLFDGTWSQVVNSPVVGAIGAKADIANLLTYSLTASSMSTITETLNGVLIGTKTATSGQSITASCTQAQWDAVRFGRYKNAVGGLNTLVIAMGGETWTYTFEKKLASNADTTTTIRAVQDIQNYDLPGAKALIGAAIRGRGGIVSDTSNFDIIVKAIAAISVEGLGGRKFAKGVENPVNESGAYMIRLTTLTFTPSIVIVFKAVANGSEDNAQMAVMINKNIVGRVGNSKAVISGQLAMMASTFDLTIRGFNARVWEWTAFDWIAIE